MSEIVRGVISRQGNDLSDPINAIADHYGCTPRGLLALCIAESNLDEEAARYGEWPDVSFGIAQQTVKYAVSYGIGDGTNSPDNILRVRWMLTNDVMLALKTAARQIGYYYRLYGSWEEAVSRYNGGPNMAWADNPNRRNYENAWAESARYVVAVSREDELETQLGEMKRVVREILIPETDALLQIPRLPKAARDKIAFGIRPALSTIERLGAPQ